MAPLGICERLRARAREATEENEEFCHRSARAREETLRGVTGLTFTINLRARVNNLSKRDNRIFTTVRARARGVSV